MPPLLLPSRNRTTAELQQTVTVVGVGAAVVLAAVLYFTLRTVAPRAEEPSAPPVAASEAVPQPPPDALASVADDIAVHISNVRTDTRQATERIKAAQVQLGEVRSSLDVNYMEGTKRRAERADALIREAFRLIQQSLDELDQADRLSKKVR